MTRALRMLHLTCTEVHLMTGVLNMIHLTCAEVHLSWSGFFFKHLTATLRKGLLSFYIFFIISWSKLGSKIVFLFYGEVIPDYLTRQNVFAKDTPY